MADGAQTGYIEIAIPSPWTFKFRSKMLYIVCSRDNQYATNVQSQKTKGQGLSVT